MDNLVLDFEKYKSKILRLKKYTSQMSILFAEDYEELHKSILRILKSLFKSVDGAYDGLQALSLYKKNSYDFVLSDISMPNMNGIELAQHIKKIDSMQKIIVLSAHRDANYLHELINIGIHRFVEKPISLENLIDELYIVCKDLYDEDKIKNNIILNANTIYKMDQQDILIDNVIINLTNYEKNLLYIFIKKLNQNISIDEIVNEFYLDNIDIDSENIRKHIYKLRKKLPKNLITNLHGVGYRIVSDT
ncbi:MAG: response regulator transcription factor [Sulfurimonas sp.]|nr:response regulator transcription factor [Sulfurimonas sp.]